VLEFGSKMKKSPLFYLILLQLNFLAETHAATINTCDMYKSVIVGAYGVQTNYWNPAKCPGTQCLSIDDQSGSYTVTKGTFDCGYNVASYPSIYYGSGWGVSSPASDLPAQVSALKCVTSSWEFKPTRSGAWDAAYDIWFCPDHSCGKDGFNGGAEIMIWLDYMNTNGWKEDLGPVRLAGRDWEAWQFEGSSGKSRWQYVAYLAKKRVTAIKDLDLKAFFDDAQKRGYIKPAWYLYAVEAGNEFHEGGIPFTSKSFSVSVNRGCKP
jgi:hypothetical protein